MPKLQLGSTEKDLLQLLKNALHTGEPCKVSSEVWDDIIRESVSQTVECLALSGAEECDVPQEFLDIWSDFVIKRIRANYRIHAGHCEVHRILTERDVPYCILKGSASAQYYPEPELRRMGDVDILVAKEDAERASRALQDAGFELWEKEYEKHLVFQKDEVRLELHDETAGMPEGKNGKILKQYMQDVFATSGLAENPAGVFCSPDKLHHGLILILHTYHHWLGEGIGLRHLCDMALWMDTFSDEEFSDMFQDKLSAVGLWRFAQVLGQISHRYLGIPYRSWMGQEEKDLCAELMQDVFYGGNFGRKDTTRSYQGMMISNQGQAGVGKNSLMQTIKTLNHEAYYQFPVLRSVKGAKCFGWILLGGRRVFRLATGKRKRVSLKDTAQKAEERKKIYQQLRLFENEEE